MTSAIGSTRIVLQGEFAVIKGGDALIKTTIPKTCTVFTLYNKESKIRVLAHSDDYTGVVKAIINISGILENRFSKPIHSFTAKVFGGTDDKFSKTQQELVLATFKQMKVGYDIVPLSDQRSQSVFNANGEVVFLEKEEINNRLEFLQLREYGEWNNFLDQNYGHLSGDKIPYFESKESSRLETDIPYFEMKNLDQESIKKAQLLEGIKSFKLPIQAERTVIQNNTDVIIKLQKLINEKTPVLIKKSIEKKDFNLLLRQLSVKPEYINLLKVLLDNKLKLNINVESRGEKSGTAMDIAKRSKNQQAIDLLK